MAAFDWLITNGRVIDPHQSIDRITQIAIKGSRIAALGDSLSSVDATQVYDAKGQIITPGLIDLHIHGYHHVTPLGVDVDHFCLGRGVTTAVDAGSAGCDTFAGFRHYAAELSRTRLLALLHISRAGLAFSSRTGGEDPGELETLKLVNAGDCIDCVEANRDLIVGIKIRLSASIADEGRNEATAFERAQEAARIVQLPLMTHHNFSSIPLEDCPGKMGSGDIYTHCFHAYPNTILKAESHELHPAVIRARSQGVLFDLGHGMGSFSWTVAEACASQEFWPNTISTDIHSLNIDGPVYDMPTVMTRMLRVGMPLTDVIRASTINPAKAIGWEDRIGTLEVGREADITALRLAESSLELEDCHAQLRKLSHRIVPQSVWRAGQQGTITAAKRFPNPESYTAAIEWRSKLIIQD